MKGARTGFWLRSILAVVVLAAALAYLRDPPWVGRVTTGLRGWTRDAQGVRFRWTNGRAAFYVPAGAASITLPLRAGLARPQGAPTVTVSVDGRRVAARRLEEPGRWESLTVPLNRKPTTRRFRRVEVRVDEVIFDRNLGVQLGEVVVQWAPASVPATGSGGSSSRISPAPLRTPGRPPRDVGGFGGST